jgi:hypothetical protein
MTAATADVAAYLAAVRSSLSDLPEAERDDLVAEVEASLRGGAAVRRRTVRADKARAEPTQLLSLPSAARAYLAVGAAAYVLDTGWSSRYPIVPRIGSAETGLLLIALAIRYYEPGTKRVERPNAAPYVELPLVVMPPLPTKRR